MSVPASAVLLLSACAGNQSALDPQGPAARSIASISWVMFIGAAAILTLVMVLALIAVFRPGRTPRTASDLRFIVGGGVVFPVVTLTLLLVYGVYQMGDLRAEPPSDQVQIEVVGNRWWWDVHYLDENGNRLVTTANEIRIPAGAPVSVFLRTEDVIHSFWVPNLAGKIDLVPGRRNHVRLQADAPGVFRGQCAEYCGAQHARMAFHVIAETPAHFEQWLVAQRRPATPPATEASARGREAFVARCIECHTVRGVGEASERGPDLTHFGSRRTIAAGTLENNRDNLLHWIAHSQQVKPANGMPDFAHLEKQELEAIATWLEGLR